MMNLKDMIELVNSSIQIVKASRKIKLLFFFPVAISLLLYSYLFWLFIHSFLPYSKIWLFNHLHFLNAWDDYLKYPLYIILIFLFLIIFNYTFVLMTSLISAPFFQIISNTTSQLQFRLERKETFSFYSIYLSFKNEFKKISLLIFLQAIILILGIFPIFTPFAFLFSGVLLSIQFLDYSFSREELNLSSILKFVLRHFLVISILGSLISILMLIPILNLITLQFSVVFYTLFYERVKLNL